MALTGLKDLDLTIMMELNDRDLLSLCSTNKEIYNLCNNETFWRNRFIKRFGDAAAKYKPVDRKWKNHYMKVVIDLDMFSKDPWWFLQYIQWSPKGAKFSKFIGNKDNSEFSPIMLGNRRHEIPFLEAPEWVMNNFYLLQIPNFKYNDIKYSNITPAKLFEIKAKDLNQNMIVNGYGIYTNRRNYKF